MELNTINRPWVRSKNHKRSASKLLLTNDSFSNSKTPDEILKKNPDCYNAVGISHPLGLVRPFSCSLEDVEKQ